jgi:hypothetical protein
MMTTEEALAELERVFETIAAEHRCQGLSLPMAKLSMPSGRAE